MVKTLNYYVIFVIVQRRNRVSTRLATYGTDASLGIGVLNKSQNLESHTLKVADFWSRFSDKFRPGYILYYNCYVNCNCYVLKIETKICIKLLIEILCNFFLFTYFRVTFIMVKYIWDRQSFICCFYRLLVSYDFVVFLAWV